MASSDAVRVRVRRTRDEVAPGQAGDLGLRAIGRVVRLLCEVRLVILLLGVVSALAGRSTGLGWLLIALLAAPFSAVPAWSWERRGPLLTRSGILLAGDMVTTAVVVLALRSAELGIAYAAASVTLLGVMVGTRLALFMSVPIGLALLGAATFAPQPVPWPVVGVGVAGLVTMAWAGNALGRSLTAQAEVGAELSGTQARQAALAERVRIARDLHDTVAADLAGATLIGATLVRRLEQDGADPATRRLAEQLLDSCRVAHRDTRTALGELRRAEDPTDEDLAEICARWTARTGIACTGEVAAGLGELDPGLRADLRAIVLELLENVRRHSGAGRAEVRVDRDGDAVRVTVTDDGRGLPAPGAGATGAPTPEPGHYGLVGIAERARAHDGDVVVADAPGGGLRAVVRLRAVSVAGPAAAPAVPHAVPSTTRGAA